MKIKPPADVITPRRNWY